MRTYDIITKKKHGECLTKEEISFLIEGYTKGDIPDCQMSAFLMAVCLKGMTRDETAELTMCMANSGDIVDLRDIYGIKVDKHSTGGVGDKTTLIVAPIVASTGVPVAKMSGRGLGHTGGTIDKLESIPGFRTAFSREEFISIVNASGICVSGQSGDLAPADKKIYALRDITATVDSIPLIAASIMSKKIAAGSDAILLDVKTGGGAFMKTLADALTLADTMVHIGASVGRETVALITNMDIPLGFAIGNSNEIAEATLTLKGKGPKDLTDICISLASEMLCLADMGNEEECMELVKRQIISGKAFNKLVEMVRAQGGDGSYIIDTDKFKKAAINYEVLSPVDGYISEMDAEGCGIVSCMLGAGRVTEESIIDYSAGIILKAKTGDKVAKGGVLAVLHTSDLKLAQQSGERLISCYKFSDKKPQPTPIIYARVSKDGVKRF